MIVVTNRITVSPGREAEFEAKFERRARLVERAPGFSRMEIMRPIPRARDAEGNWQPDLAKPGEYEVRTWWHSLEDFDDWRRSASFHEAHSKVLSERGQPSVDQLPDGMVEQAPQVSFHAIIMHAVKSR